MVSNDKTVVAVLRPSPPSFITLVHSAVWASKIVPEVGSNINGEGINQPSKSNSCV